MKRGLLVTTLFAASTLVLTSCVKTISYEDAKKHVADNFTSTETKMFDAETVTKVTKVDGLFSTAYTVGEKTDKSSGLMGVIKAQALELFGANATYKVDGKKLFVEHTFDLKVYLQEQGIELGENDEASGKVFGKVETDDEGYVAKEYYSIEDLHVKITSDFGLSVEGNLSMESTVTYTARPAN